MPSIYSIKVNLRRSIDSMVGIQIGHAISGPSPKSLNLNSWSAGIVGNLIVSSIIPRPVAFLQEPYQIESVSPLLRGVAKAVMYRATGAALGSAILGICGADGLTMRDAVSSSILGSTLQFGAGVLAEVIFLKYASKYASGNA